MAPNSKNIPTEDQEKNTFKVNNEIKLPADIGTDWDFKRPWVWKNIIGFFFLHCAFFYGAHRAIYNANILTTIWGIVVIFGSGQGVTIGGHRLYAHKSFKARFLLRAALILLHTVAGQNCMYIWVRDHRLHHKYSDTDADPHNSNRGFFFSHIGWLLSRKHPAVIAKGKTIDMSDLEADFFVMFQKFFYKPMYLLFALAIPVAVPVYLWDETYWDALFVAYFARYILTLHITWLVNSAAHLYGTKPYDRSFGAVESWFVSLATVGEGWHNYHHAFPWDYRAAEYGTHYSITTFLIDILAKLGLAYDLKTTPDRMVEQRVYRTGDPSYRQKIVDGKVLDINGNEINPKLTLKQYQNDNYATGQQKIT